MAQLTLLEILLVLRDIVGAKAEALSRSSAGALYIPKLKKLLAEIEGLPPILNGGKPVAEELASTDALHDALGRAIHYLLEAYLSHPIVTDSDRQAAARIRQAFLPELKELQQSYAIEAASAVARQSELERLRADLDRFPVQGGVTLWAWAEAFVGQGLRLEELLRQRGDTEATRESRADASRLRSLGLRLLTGLRTALTDEVADDASFEPGFVDGVFSLFDQLKKARTHRERGGQPKPSADEAAASDAGAQP